MHRITDLILYILYKINMMIQTPKMFVADRQVRSLAYFASAKAHSSNIRRGKHCALILDEDRRVIASFVNCGIVHAEEGAINLITSSEKKNLTLLVVRTMSSTGEIKFSKPCSKCEAAIQRAKNIRTVIFSMDHGEFGHYSLHQSRRQQPT
jgi:hypothetical protein